jgi:hypothetical protein
MIFPGFHFVASGLRVWISTSAGTAETYLWGLNDAAETISTLAADAALGIRFGGNARVYAKEYLDRDAIRSHFERRIEDLGVVGQPEADGLARGCRCRRLTVAELAAMQPL